jgi:hypothetical protein
MSGSKYQILAMKYQVFAFPLKGDHFESPVFECENDDEAQSIALRYAAKRATSVELCRVRFKPHPQVLIVDTIDPPAKATKRSRPR